eukprot:gnl/MRDRNA2_/MRDRNA2_259802_c0_seq1.p1 gnl/MRDRNA2_/MRDRNA2_259802_c0~~gnl/MRDRNA2_/MRDRNA2_259802_c0_seq1.p1  ORF type:complete len:228 (-),score=32.98 gnl/MRDRNA2_/MRDRNA2_259802_c0_seq1:253-864(-)
MHATKSTKMYEGILVAFNSGHEEYTYDLPEDKEWYRIIDTSLEAPDDICEDQSSALLIDTPQYKMSPYSCIVLTTVQTFQEFQFLVHCDCSSPGEVVAIVGSAAALGSWDPYKAVVCTTNEEEFPIWSSPTIGLPMNSLGKFDFKLLLKGEESIHWEVGENHEVAIPEALQENETVVIKCGWGLDAVKCYVTSELEEKMETVA